MIIGGEGGDLEKAKTFYRTAMLDAFVQTHIVMTETQFYDHGGPFIYITDLLGSWINNPDLAAFDVTTVGISYAMAFGTDRGMDGLGADKAFMAGDMKTKLRKMKEFADALMMRVGMYEESLDKLVDKNLYVDKVRDIYSQLSGQVFPQLSQNADSYVGALRYLSKQILSDPKKVGRLMDLVEEDKGVEGLISHLRPAGFTAGYKEVIFDLN